MLSVLFPGLSVTHYFRFSSQASLSPTTFVSLPRNLCHPLLSVLFPGLSVTHYFRFSSQDSLSPTTFGSLPRTLCHPLLSVLFPGLSVTHCLSCPQLFTEGWLWTESCVLRHVRTRTVCGLSPLFSKCHYWKVFGWLEVGMGG